MRTLKILIAEAPIETSIGDIPTLICDYGHIYQKISSTSHTPGENKNLESYNLRCQIRFVKNAAESRGELNQLMQTALFLGHLINSTLRYKQMAK
jgi:hypothetical protein